MSDNKILLLYLTKAFPNNSPIVYIYCAGGYRSKKTAKLQLLKNIDKVFGDGFLSSLKEEIVDDYLNHLNYLYTTSKISIKPIY